ncbi:MAG: hypothetical protein DPW16_05375 [Chloroflexi bacterium]|nr:hypothetical protein [Chloroflexota bacterium]
MEPIQYGCPTITWSLPCVISLLGNAVLQIPLQWVETLLTDTQLKHCLIDGQYREAARQLGDRIVTGGQDQ